MAVRDSLQALQDFDVGDLDFDNIGSWPGVVKTVLWALAFILVCLLGYHFYVKNVIADHEVAKAQELKLRASFKDKAHKAANLDAYREQMEEMEETFGALVRQLPSETDVPGLLEDIDNKAVASGLEVLSIKLQAERSAEFYVELPIEIIVSGTYHDLGSFVSGVAGLPRIVTLHDFSIELGKENDGALVLTITAKTYRYKDDDSDEEGAK